MSDEKVPPAPVPYESRTPLLPPPPILACPKCDGEMRAGVLTTPARYGWALLGWTAGVIGKGLFGRAVPPSGRRLSVVTYKCDRCGYLESYGQSG